MKQLAKMPHATDPVPLVMQTPKPTVVPVAQGGVQPVVIGVQLERLREVRFGVYGEADGGHEISSYGHGAVFDAHGDVEGGYGAMAGYKATDAEDLWDESLFEEEEKASELRPITAVWLTPTTATNLTQKELEI